MRNMSGRANVGTGDNVAIAGIVLGGSGSEEFIIRGIGPSIPLPNRLADPYLSLHNANGSIIAQNNNWKDTQQAQIASTNLAPPNDLEAAIRIRLNTGSYTAILSGVNGGTGIGSLDIYEIESGGSTRMHNISTRANISGFGNEQAFVGVTVDGGGTTDLLFRGRGPTIPLPNRLQNPYLTLYDAAGNALYWNDNWRDSQEGPITVTGVAPSHDAESAIRRKLSAGQYTVILHDYSGGAGIGSVEVYNVDNAPAGTPTPAPTATPPPQRLLWNDKTARGTYVGKSSSNPNGIEEVKRSAVLYPSAPGKITVRYRARAFWLGGPGTPSEAHRAAVYPQLLNQSGGVISRGAGAAPLTTEYGPVQSTSFTGNGSPFIIRVMAESAHWYPQPDYATVEYLEVYAP